jgi:TPP-dependent pyruvate/acetoin dehydrogenase alpha subunit
VSSSPTDATAEPPAPAAVEPAGLAPEVPRELRLALFRLVLLQRLIEERIMTLYRQGRIPGSVYTGRGQEGVAAGAGLALGPDDAMAPVNREMAAHLARGVEVAQVFRQYLGRATGPTGGRDGNMHFGSVALNVFPLPSMLGSLIPVTVGAALAFKRRGEPRVALTFFGDGTMSTGDVHEGLNLAAVLKVPAVFVMQNNGYAYSTPIDHQMANTNMSERIRGGWGIPSERVDGTDALAVYASVLGAIERARGGGGPQAVEALSLRMEGHAAHDDGRYMDQDRKRTFADRFDPVERLAARLRLDGLELAEIEALRTAAAAEVSDGLAEAESAPAPDASTLAEGVYATPPEGFSA